MARKKRRKSRSKKGGLFQSLGTVFSVSWDLFKKALPSLTVLLVFTGLFFGVRKALYADNQLSVRTIQIEPAGSIGENRLRMLESDLLGRNILKVDLKQTALSLQNNPQVQSARISRSLPDTVKVNITGRRPAALVQLSPGGTYGVVSSDGMILDMVESTHSTLVTIECYHTGISRPRVGLQIRDRGFAEAVKLADAWYKDPVAQKEKLTRISVDASGHVTVTLGSGPDIRMGRKPVTRLGTLHKVMHLLDSQDRMRIEYIDLQFDNVVVKRKK